MKFKKLALSFLYLFIGVATCSFTSNKSNVSLVETTSRSDIVHENNEIDTELGTLNADLTVQLRSYAVTELSASFQVLINFSETANLQNNYYVGYLGEGDEYLPASLRFYVKQTDGQIVQRSAAINKAQQNNNYDGLGSSLGANSLNTYCDIDIAYGEEVLYDTGIELFNIFPYNTDTRTVDLDNPTYSSCITTSLDANVFAPIYNSEDFFKLSYNGSSNFSGYSTFTFNVEDRGIALYESLSATTARAFMEYEDYINDGRYYIRSILSFGGNTEFVLTHKDGTIQRLESTSMQYEVTGGGQVVLLFENIDADDIEKVEIYDLYYQLGIYNPDTGRDLNRTTFNQRFGRIYTGMEDLKDSSGVTISSEIAGAFNINYDLIVGLTFGLSTLIFLGIVIPSYFYLKKKNRNDEFKRMNTKSYVTTATMGYLTIESVLLLVVFIVIRSTTFANSLVVYNPTDPYIIVLGVASIILVGYFIRYFVIAAKNNAEKRRRDKLKINQDVIDDGTLIIRK